METKQEKILYILTYAGEKPETASMPFVMGAAALAMEIEATVVLQGNAVYLAQKGYSKHVLKGGGFPPLKKLMDEYLELGGKLWVCVPCIKERNIALEDLIEGAETTAAGKVNAVAIEANATFVY